MPRYKRRSSGSPYLVDCNLDNDDSRRARRALTKGDWHAAEDFVRSRPSPSERAWAVEALADWPGRSPAIQRWIGEQRTPIALAVAAVNDMKWAWEARGGRYANFVKSDQWRNFSERLQIVRTSLQAAWNADQKDASIAPWLIWCARGLSDSRMARTAFEQATRRAPSIRATYSSMLLSHASKWGGSDEECLDFARQTMASAPPECGAAVLVVEAHYYLYEQLTPMSEEYKAYWKSPMVRNEVLMADDVCLRSGLNGMNGVRNRHWLAYGLWKCGERLRAKAHFQELGRASNEWPWGGFIRGFNWLFNPYPYARRGCMRAK